MALLYSCREEYAIHIQQGLGSRKCGDSLPPKWILKFTYLYCSHGNGKTLLTYSHRRLCKRNCRRKNRIMPGKKVFNEVPFFRILGQLRVTVCAFGNRKGKVISCCSMNLPTLWDLVFVDTQCSMKVGPSNGKSLKTWEPAVLTNLKHWGFWGMVSANSPGSRDCPKR